MVNLDRRRELSNAHSCELLGIDFRDAKASLLETADYLIKHKLSSGHDAKLILQCESD